MKATIQLFRSSQLLFVLALIVITGCDKASFNTNLLIKGDPAYFDVPVTSDATFDIKSKVTMNVNEWATKNNFDVKKVNSIKVNELVLSIVDTTSKPYTFDIIDMVEWSIVSGKGAVLASAQTPNDKKDGKTSMTLTVKDTDIKSIMSDTLATLRLNGTLNAPVEHPFKFKADVKYTINAATLN